MCLGGTELAGARPGPAAPARTDEVGGEDVRWPYWTLENIIPLTAGFAGLFGSEYLVPSMLGLMGASALLCSVNTWLPELMRRSGFGQTASLAFGCNNGPPRSEAALCYSRCRNFLIGLLLLIVRSRDWARAVRSRATGSGQLLPDQCSGAVLGALGSALVGTGGPLVGLLIGAGLSFHAIL